MNAATGIQSLFDGALTMFSVIYAGGINLFSWFATPISPSGDPTIDLVFESFYGYTPFELSFGVFLSSILFMAIFKFLIGFITSA